MNKVFVVVSDNNYLEHAKYLFNCATTIGNWKGDLCLIANNVDKYLLEDFKKFNVEIFEIKNDNVYYANFSVFDTFFKRWDFVTYLDCDFTIFGDLNNLVNQKIMSQPLLSMETEPFYLHQYFCQKWDEQDKSNALKDLYNEYDLDKFGYNAGHLSFNTSLIESETLNNLLKLCNDLLSINNHSGIGSDQPIFNLYFIDKIVPIEQQKVSFWRGSNENTIAQHHLHGEAPWRNKVFSKRLNKTYIENYLENLNSFYKKIKK